MQTPVLTVHRFPGLPVYQFPGFPVYQFTGLPVYRFPVRHFNTPSFPQESHFTFSGRSLVKTGMTVLQPGHFTL